MTLRLALDAVWFSAIASAALVLVIALIVLVQNSCAIFDDACIAQLLRRHDGRDVRVRLLPWVVCIVPLGR